MKKPIFILAQLIFLIIFVRSTSLNAANSSNQRTSVKITKTGKSLHLEGVMPAGISEIELRIGSDRNNSISNIKEVSVNDPSFSKPSVQKPGNTFYPVVDIVLERGMEGMAGFKIIAPDSCIVNGPFYKQKQAVKPWITISSGTLQNWENSIFVSTDSCILQSFYIRKVYPLVTRQLDITIELLSGMWSGKVSIFDVKTDTELFSETVSSGEYNPSKFADGKSLDKQRLLAALEGVIDFTQRSQVKDPCHVANGGLFLFYDLDAQLYRSYHWVWGWGPSVTMLLEASKVLPEQKKEVVKLAEEISEASLKFLYKNPNSPVDNIMISRWERKVELEDGYRGAVTIADALFMAGWAWVPMYEATGDKRFLDATAHHCKVTDELLKTWTIIPHSYYIDNGVWSDWVIDETGFGMEPFDKMFRVTGDKFYQQVGLKFMEGHLKTFERPDGQWNRRYQYSDSAVTQNTRMVRGMGWAMEGLLAANRLDPGGKYLAAAEKMAQHILKSQHSDGSWSFEYDKPVEEIGVGEKATALWSYLFYETYKLTKDKVYLDAARKALVWCLNNQYDGPDPEAYGSVVGSNPHSGVGYRKWFNVSCTYTSAFMGMAILEELSL